MTEVYDHWYGEMPDHEQDAERRVGRLVHRDENGPLTGARKAGRQVASLLLPRRMAGVCAVPGVSLTNYSVGPSGKGWGAHCTGGHTTLTLKNGVRITVRSEIAELSTLILNECLRRGYNVRQADTGSYNCRLIAGSNTWSNHAWALAIDINWQSNPYTSGTTHDIPDWMAKLFNRYGFAWGGDYTGSRRDYMHMEFMGTPAQAATATALARRELTGTPPTPPTGKEVVLAMQRALNFVGTEVDGIWGNQTERGVNTIRNAINGVFPYGVKEAQTRVGATADGSWGPASATALIQTVKELQAAWGVGADGQWGPNTEAAWKAAQAKYFKP
jgi:hypothetical protein